MEQALRILILEDYPADAELVEYELQEAAITFVSTCVKTKAAYLQKLSEFSPDIILSDYSLPSFNGLAALKIAQERYPDLPFIFVTGAMGEEKAVELLKEGATDYILKDRLSRLGPAVLRAMQEAGERKELRKYEQALKESEVRYRTIFENTGTAAVIIDEQLFITLANKQFEQLSGWRKPDIEGGKNLLEFVYEDDIATLKECTRLSGTGTKRSTDEHAFRLVNRQGDVRNVLATIAAMPLSHHAVISLLDITERKAAEEALKQRELELQMKSQNLEDANTALKVLLKRREEDKSVLEEKVVTNVRQFVLPYVEDLKGMNINKQHMALLEVIEQHLNDIISPFLKNLSAAYLDLTPREIQIANLVREGKTTKEITACLHISATAVDFHRKNLRTKFGIKNSATNLRSYLLSLSA
jgi:PAS domain S-box-containing protein